MKKTLYIIAISLVLAGIIHILIVLLIPSYAERDAWAKLEAKGEPWKFFAVAEPGAHGSNLPVVDPYFGVSACRYDLNEAPVLVVAQGQVPFWSVAIFDRKGRNIYSFNDRTATDRQLFLMVVNPVQMAQLRKNPTAESAAAILVESEVNQGFVLIRAFQPDESWKPGISTFLQSATCEKYAMVESNG